MAERGQDYILQISAAGSSYTPIGKLTNVSFKREMEEIEANNFDSADWKETLAGIRSWGFSGEALYVYDDSGQVLVEAAFLSNTAYYYRLTSDAGTAGVIQFTGQGRLTSLEWTGGMNELVATSFEVSGTGQVTAVALT